MRSPIIVAALLLVAASAAFATMAPDTQEPAPDPTPDPDPEPGIIDVIMGTNSAAPTPQAAVNRTAFLLMIRKAEGTSGLTGYRMFYGGGLFSDMSAHPNERHTAAGITSTAAGAYQFRYQTWMECRNALNLPDFSPASQDAAAIFLIKRRGALGDVDSGNFADAVRKCRQEWASFPGAGYKQHEYSLADLQAFYLTQGGTLA